jgi:oligopeptide/dipeptide ABC transporter ATP-binding protein
MTVNDSDLELQQYLFDLQGYLVIPDVLGPTEVAELNRLIDAQGLPSPRERIRFGSAAGLHGPDHGFLKTSVHSGAALLGAGARSAYAQQAHRAPGRVANPTSPPTRCYFHPRGPYAVERCRTETPAWRELPFRRFVSCHRAEELQLAGVD